ncbi:hypothetical protein ACBQ54_18380 [Providencia vermicola]|uniref:hypothetical protein n=1 Tax=Providencia vermicola TaxID=333965 RepID=UPI002AB3F5AC|nr:hypothetical protein [Providencia stuartii]
MMVAALPYLAQAQAVSPFDFPTDNGTDHSCTLLPAEGGLYHYARLPAELVKNRETTVLPSMTKTWAIQCTAATTVSFEVQDLQSDSVGRNDKTRFGLGYVNVAGKLGSFAIEVSRATVDNDDTFFNTIDNRAATTNNKTKMAVSQGQSLGWYRGDESALAVGQTFTLDITVTPTLNSLQETNGPLVNGAELDGLAQFIFTFGL